MSYRCLVFSLIAYGSAASLQPAPAQDDPFGSDAPPSAKSPGQASPAAADDPFGSSPVAAPKVDVVIREDAASCQTADELWAYIGSITKGNLVKNLKKPGATYDTEAQKILDAARAFIKQYPRDPRVGEVKIIYYDGGSSARRTSRAYAPNEAELAQILVEVADSPDLPQRSRAIATERMVGYFRDLAAKNPADAAKYWDALEARILKFQGQAASDSTMWGAYFMVRLRGTQLNALKHSSEQDRYRALLEKLQTDPNPGVATKAKALWDALNQIADLKVKPWDLKFTAVDGKAVDLSQMRGKVVLVIFWATSSFSSMQDLFLLKSTLKDLQNKGIEIVGISYDTKLSSLNQMTQRDGITWPQYFDGKGKDNLIGKPFAITTLDLPVMWLIDKKGLLAKVCTRETLAADAKKVLNGL